MLNFWVNFPTLNQPPSTHVIEGNCQDDVTKINAGCKGGIGKVGIRAKWPIRPKLILVSEGYRGCHLVPTRWEAEWPYG